MLEEKRLQAMERVVRLGEENARLQQQLAAACKDSSTSSKPPSSDIVKPKRPLPEGGRKRKKGGQPGHEQHLRSPFLPEAVGLAVSPIYNNRSQPCSLKAMVPHLVNF